MEPAKQAAERLSAIERAELLRWLKARIRFEGEQARQARLRKRTLRGAVWATIAALMLFFALDGALFHSGFYNSYVEPNSSAGEVEGHIRWFDDARVHKHEVIVMGDSRVAEGFSARTANAAVADRFHFTNFGVPGSSPRIWYYMVRDADPDLDRFDAVVLQLPQYSDAGSSDDSEDHIGELNFLAGRLRYTDCIPFAHSFVTPAFRRDALTGCLLRGITFRPDLHAFLHGPSERIRRATDWMTHGFGYIDGYGGMEQNVVGLSADFEARTLTLPPGLNESQIRSIRATVLPGAVPEGMSLTAYRRRWLGAIIDLYRNSKTRIVFMETPRAPLPLPEAKTPRTFLREALSRPHVGALPAQTFRDLERPETFGDGLHLNRQGRPIFSARLGERIAALLGAR